MEKFKKDPLERFFKHPRLIAGVIAAITVFFGVQLPKARMDNNVLSFLPDDNPAKINTRHFEDEYGASTAAMVGLERPYGTVFDREWQEDANAVMDAIQKYAAANFPDAVRVLIGGGGGAKRGAHRPCDKQSGCVAHYG